MKQEKLPDGIDPEVVKTKMEAGLTLEQAIAVLQAQADNDKAQAALSEPSGGVETVFSENNPTE